MPEPVPAPPLEGAYSFDPEHSQIVFSYDHMGFSTSYGTIGGVSGTVTLHAEKPETSTVEAAFPLSAVRTIAPGLDEALQGKDFLDGAAPATAVTFTSTAVKPTGARTAEVTGDLLLNGITKPVTLSVEITQDGLHPMTQRPAVGFQATGTIRRSDFGLGAFAPAVSDEVAIRIGVEASKG